MKVTMTERDQDRSWEIQCPEQNFIVCPYENTMYLLESETQKEIDISIPKYKDWQEI